jgi:deoxyribose-phosphate aldolase
VAFVKTSTGYGFVKHPGDGRGLNLYTYKGATVPHILLMKANVGPNVRVKAAGGIRTLDEVLLAMSLGVGRIGASATEAILEEAVARGIGAMPVEVPLRSSAAEIQGGAY